MIHETFKRFDTLAIFDFESKSAQKSPFNLKASQNLF
jgi:hypothetical protein